MKIIDIQEYNTIIKVDYDGGETIMIYPHVVIYYNHYHRILYERDTQQFSYENIDTSEQYDLPYLLDLSEEEYFQQSLVMKTLDMLIDIEGEILRLINKEIK